MTHDLKTLPVFFKRVANYDKTFEIRLNDRDFQVGDRLNLYEYDPVTESYSGQVVAVDVTYLLSSHQIAVMPGHCVMGIDVKEHWEDTSILKPAAL